MNDGYRQYQVEHVDFLKEFRNHFWRVKNKELPGIGRNATNLNDRVFLGWPGTPYDENNFFEKNLDLWKKLEEVTYPFGKPIIGVALKFYQTNEYSPLHFDGLTISPYNKEVTASWTNSILLEKSEDMEGG